MGRIVLVTGGARSGKSTFAEKQFRGKTQVVYIATSRIYDDEMKERVKLHRSSRPIEWVTFEGNYRLAEVVCDYRDYLLDCITVLTSNIMFDITQDAEIISFELQKQVEDKVLGEIKSLINCVRAIAGDLVMVTNEVGYSIVPDNHIARVYRDIAGRVNQQIAALCDEVYLVACGLPLKLK
jgi:adenosylcobinamide kinase/adenosylcobinamide-phosphate guanylyltransferase